VGALKVRADAQGGDGTHSTPTHHPPEHAGLHRIDVHVRGPGGTGATYNKWLRKVRQQPARQQHFPCNATVSSVACGPLLWGEGPPLEDQVLG